MTTVTTATNLTKLMRWSGLAAMLGGLLFALGIPLHPLRDGEAVNHSPYSAIHVLIALALMLMLLGLVGLYVRQAAGLGAFGMLGFFMAFIGNALAFGGIMTEGFMWPAVALFAPAAVHTFDLNSPVGQVSSLLMFFFLGGLVLFAVGYTLFGVATIRVGDLPRWGGFLLAIGAVLYAAGGFSLPLFGPHSLLVTIFETSGAIPFGLGFVWMGYALWRRRASVANVQEAQERIYTR